jgi:predicted AAA+ superfamily ATPase
MHNFVMLELALLKMIKRLLFEEAEETAREFKIVSVTGPRQSGKTTLCKHVFRNKPYVSFEDLDILEKAESFPRDFIDDYKDGAVFDEIQRVPGLFNYLQTHVDRVGKNNQYVISGSNNFLLQQSISQSLAGRAAYIELLPFSLLELQEHWKETKSPEFYMLNGFYPSIITKQSSAERWLPNYLKTYIERDVRMIRNIENLNLFSKFVKLAAARSGQILNINNLSNETGVDNKTINAWISVLESSYIVYRLQPYYNSFNKRVIKSPKLYFYDVGLLCNILGLNNEQSIKSSKMYGAIFENLIISEIKKNRFNKSQFGDMYYLRDSTGNEVDLVLEKEGNLLPIEIKSSAFTTRSDYKNLKWFQKLYRINGGILINQNKGSQELEDGIMNLFWTEVANV